MAKKDNRFIISYSQENFTLGVRGMVDRQTGVNYLFFRDAGAGGLTPLLDREGRPVITAVYDEG